MATTEYVDTPYYEVARPRSLGERMVILARDRIYANFMKVCHPSATSKILDVGVSDVINHAANVLERRYANQQCITAAGLGDGSSFRNEFPKISYVQIEAGKPLPFSAASFDIATSNAVLEHVGSKDAQRQFIKELMRVANLVYVTVPYRFFPIEHHTAIPLLHFSDTTFRLACKATGKTFWADPENLILMSKSRLKDLLPEGANAHVTFCGLPLGPFSSNLALTIDQR